MVRVRAHQGVLHAHADVSVSVLAVRVHLRGIGRITFDSQNAFVKRQVTDPLDNLAAEPVGAFVVLPARSAHFLFRRMVLLEIFEDKDFGSVLTRKIDDLAGNLPRGIFVEMADFAPEIDILLDSFWQSAALNALATDDIEQSMPFVIQCAAVDKLGGDPLLVQKRPHHRQAIDTPIHGDDRQTGIFVELFFGFLGCLDRFLHGHMQGETHMPGIAFVLFCIDGQRQRYPCPWTE